MSKHSKDKKELTQAQLEKVAGGEHHKTGDGYNATPRSPYPRLHPKPSGSSTSSSSSTSGSRQFQLT